MTYTLKMRSTGILLIKHGVLYRSRVAPHTWIANMYPSGFHEYRGVGKRWNTFGTEISWLEFVTHPVRSYSRIYKILRHP